MTHKQHGHNMLNKVPVSPYDKKHTQLKQCKIWFVLLSIK